jgi:hypothetical protein
MCYVGHDCLTYNGEPCIFPFKVYGNTYNECSWVDAPDDKAWCSTQVDADGHHLQSGAPFPSMENRASVGPSAS